MDLFPHRTETQPLHIALVCARSNLANLRQDRPDAEVLLIVNGPAVEALLDAVPGTPQHLDEAALAQTLICPNTLKKLGRQVQATFQRSDGIVLVDNERCVGCGYCVQACPYDARFINHETQTADKYTFCEHRLETGLLPACVESCVGGARVIGDLNDEASEIRQRMPVFVALSLAFVLAWWLGRPQWLRWLAPLLAVSALTITAYTGAELMAMRSRPLWNTLWVPLNLALTGWLATVGCMLVTARWLPARQRPDTGALQALRVLGLALGAGAVPDGHGGDLDGCRLAGPGPLLPGGAAVVAAVPGLAAEHAGLGRGGRRLAVGAGPGRNAHGLPARIEKV